jgi:hypothetical protein
MSHTTVIHPILLLSNGMSENMITIKNVPLEKTSPGKLPIFQFKISQRYVQQMYTSDTQTTLFLPTMQQWKNNKGTFPLVNYLWKNNLFFFSFQQRNNISKNMTHGLSNISHIIISYLSHLEKFHSIQNMGHWCNSCRTCCEKSDKGKFTQHYGVI